MLTSKNNINNVMQSMTLPLHTYRLYHLRPAKAKTFLTCIVGLSSAWRMEKERTQYKVACILKDFLHTALRTMNNLIQYK